MRWPLLKKGDRGEAVRLIQTQLNAIAAVFPEFSFSGPVDGSFGPITQGAVRQLQRVGNIVVDGVIGPQTRARILKLLEELSSLVGRAFMPQYRTREWLITGKNRPGTTIVPKFVTIHQTGNPRVGANAAAHRNYAMTNNRQVSYQWTADDKEAILCIPETELAWHAGRDANLNSIAIEICENQDADLELVYSVSINTIAAIALRHGFQLDQVRTHQSWTGKNCPHALLGSFYQVLADIGATMAALINSQSPEPQPEPDPLAPEPELPIPEPEQPLPEPEPVDWLTNLLRRIVAWLMVLLQRRVNNNQDFTNLELAWLETETLAEDFYLLDDTQLTANRETFLAKTRVLKALLAPLLSKRLSTFNDQ